MMRWIDSHCHLDSLEEPVEDALSNARDAGVEGVITVGTDIQTSLRATRDADTYDRVWAVVGVHPYDAKNLSDADLAALEQMLGHPKVVAVGEIGLDYYRDHSPRDSQMRAFRAQLDLAKRAGKPVVLHLRDAFAEAFEALERDGVPERLVFHCFSGDARDAETALALGGILSFAGNVSFKNAENLRDAARLAGPHRLMVETDSPYLAPMPYRGKSNTPALVPLVGSAVAKALSVGEREVADATFATAVRTFGLPL